MLAYYRIGTEIYWVLARLRLESRLTSLDQQNETLRLYSPALHIPRHTATDQTSPVFIPARTTVMLALACIHISRHLYGPDPLTFRPTRWLSTSKEPASETLITPLKGTFMPFSSGPRNCPGSKMAQVEFVSVMREIFSR